MTKKTEPNNGWVVAKADTVKPPKTRMANFKNLKFDGNRASNSSCEYDFAGCLRAHHQMNGKAAIPNADAITITITN